MGGHTVISAARAGLRGTTAALALVLLAVPAAALYQGGPGEGRAWPSSPDGVTLVPVCFRPPGTLTQVPIEGGTGNWTIDYSNAAWIARQAIVRDAVEDTWQKWTNLLFVGWETCPSDLDGFMYVDLIRNDCGGCGNVFPRGYHPAGVNVWMMMENPDQKLLRTVAVHEFGHALGIHHEMDRPDAFVPSAPTGVGLCNNKPVYYDQGTYLTPYYDDVSVMNYCAPRNRNGLSFGDLEGMQSLHGTSIEGRWLKALPAILLSTL